jgi:hypothetical protein
MKKILINALFLTTSTVFALLLMGAGSGMKNGATSASTSSLMSGVTGSTVSSAVSRTTDTIASKATGSRLKSSLTSSVTSSLSSSATGSRLKSSLTSSMTSSLSSSATGSRLKSSLTSSVTNSLSSSTTGSVSGTQVLLSPYAEEIGRTIKFDRQVLIIVKEMTHDRIGRLVGFDDDGYQIIAPGIVVSVPEDKAENIFTGLRHRLKPLHYTAFIVEMNDAIKVYKIGVLKGTDQYEILRIMHTDGDDYDISNQDVIDWLKELEQKTPFNIIGADSDWVEIEFTTLPKDLKALAEAVYDFCPDAVDQGTGSVDELAKEIKQTKRLLLWWD